MRKDTWTTWKTTSYTYNVSGNPEKGASAGGIHNHQIRRIRGRWQARIEQSNGYHCAFSPLLNMSDGEGERAWEMAIDYYS